MKTKLILIFGLALSLTSSAQSLLDQLKKEEKKASIYTYDTFKGTRVGVGHSVETRKKGVLEINAFTRYWNLPQETSNSFVADKMSARFGLEYAFTDRLTYGAGWSTINSVLDNFLKYRLVRQQDGGPNKFSLTALQTAAYRNLDVSRRVDENFGDRLLFTTQLLFARKFTRNFSFQIAPTFTHNASVSPPLDDNNQFSIGFAGRYSLGHASIFSEYYYVTNPIESADTFGLFSLGVNWELSDLLLQFKMTNNGHFSENLFITQTRRNFNFRDGNFFFGFNATYFIQL